MGCGSDGKCEYLKSVEFAHGGVIGFQSSFSFRTGRLLVHTVPNNNIRVFSERSGRQPSENRMFGFSTFVAVEKIINNAEKTKAPLCVLYAVRSVHLYGILVCRIQALRVAGRSRGKKNGTEHTVQSIRCKQAICKCQELHAPSRKSTRTPHAVRAYIPQVGYLFSSFDVLYVRKRKHGTEQQHRKDNENETEKYGRKKKITVPSHAILFGLNGTP